MIYRMCTALLASLVVVSSGFTVPASDETYDLRGPALKKGLIVRDVSKFAMKNADFSVSLANDVKLEGKIDLTSITEKEEEVLAVTGREITKLRTRIFKDETVRKTTIGGSKEDEKESKALVGEIVFSEKTKDGWKHALEDTKPNEKQEKELKNFDDPESDEDLYPGEKVKVGHAWKIDANAFKKMLGSKLSDVKGSGSGKFLRVEKIEEELCAIIEMELDIKAKIKDDDGNDFTVELKGKSLSHRSIAQGIDLKSTLEGTAKFLGKVTEDGTKAEVEFSGKMSADGTTKIKKK